MNVVAPTVDAATQAKEAEAAEAKIQFEAELAKSKAIWASKVKKDNDRRALAAETLEADKVKNHERRKKIANQHFANILIRRNRELGALRFSIKKVKFANKIAPLWSWLPGGSEQLASNAEFLQSEKERTKYILRPLSELLDPTLITDQKLIEFTEEFPADVPAWGRTELSK